MKILHLSTFDIDGGAARGSFWLHEALRERGVDSRMMVSRKHSEDSSIQALPSFMATMKARVRGRLDDLPLRRYDKTDESFWSIGWMPARFDRLIENIQPDIIHLHWVGAGFVPISSLEQFNTPIVWTLRDMWGFTGGCHYTGGCDRYLRGCGSCPQLRSERDDDLSRAVWDSKYRHWRNLDLWLVPISGWLRDCARKSPLFESYPIEVIPNGLDTNLFRPSEKTDARRAWGLPQDREIIVYGAVNAKHDRRKGYPELLDALRMLSRAGRAENILLVVFGSLDADDMPELGIETRSVGYVTDDDRLSLLYSAADAAVMPSLQEAFGKTLIEAMACGTPVVAFNTGGPIDIIEHGNNGYLAKPYSPADLATGIEWCLKEIRGGRDIGGEARAKVKADFNIESVADRYQNLYDRVLAARKS